MWETLAHLIDSWPREPTLGKPLQDPRLKSRLLDTRPPSL